MPTNPFLKKMGFADDDRVVIFHADDIGMCRSATVAYEELIEAGPLSSGSVMVPCSWFPAVADYCRRNPQADMGVHLTLTCEWDTYRWGPISTGDPTSGLLDDEGYFYRSTAEAQEHAQAEAVALEVKAQVERAIKAGIDITHIDNHMGTVFRPPFLPGYFQLARTYNVPVMVPRFSAEWLAERGMPAQEIAGVMGLLADLDGQGLPLIDQLHVTPLGKPRRRMNHIKKMLKDLPTGLTYFIIHPAVKSAELQAIAPDWRGRAADYRAFLKDDLRQFVKQAGIHVLGWRAIRDYWRQNNGS
jgi:hypothetical protein